jgi:hypothetical protein
MAADNVNPAKLESMLRRIADEVAQACRRRRTPVTAARPKCRRISVHRTLGAIVAERLFAPVVEPVGSQLNSAYGVTSIPDRAYVDMI